MADAISCAVYARLTRRAPAYRCRSGFTLVELIIVVAIVAILASLAVGSYRDFIEKSRLKDAAESVLGIIVQARSEGIVQDERMWLSIDENTWCIGFSPEPDCDCTLPTGSGACLASMGATPVRRVVEGAEFPDVALTSNFPGDRFTFNLRRLTASPAGTLRLSAGAFEAQIRVGVSGRARLCQPDGSSPLGYPDC